MKRRGLLRVKAHSQRWGSRLWAIWIGFEDGTWVKVPPSAAAIIAAAERWKAEVDASHGHGTAGPEAESKERAARSAPNLKRGDRS